MVETRIGNGLLALDERTETGQRLIPSLGYEFEVAREFGHRRRMKFKALLAPMADASDDPCLFQHAEMLGDGLTTQARTAGQLGN